MNNRQETLLVGLGSPHGDDQAGWLVAEALADRVDVPPHCRVRQAAVPVDMLDWLDEIHTLHIIDACRGESVIGTVHRQVWTEPSAAVAAARVPSVGDRHFVDHHAEDHHGRDHSEDDNHHAGAGTSVGLFPLLTRMRAGGTHDFGIIGVLELEAKLGKIPPRIVVWAIEGRQFDVGATVSAELQPAISLVADSIVTELAHA